MKLHKDILSFQGAFQELGVNGRDGTFSLRTMGNQWSAFAKSSDTGVVLSPVVFLQRHPEVSNAACGQSVMLRD